VIPSGLITVARPHMQQRYPLDRREARLGARSSSDLGVLATRLATLYNGGYDLGDR
jgi:hypothetical protein